MRVLFVDDEPRVLDGIENMLFGEADDWDLLFATTGEQALAILDAGPVDVIVTDMRMPGMDGEELLHRVRDTHPSVVRIVLSGQIDREVAERSLRSVHDFLSKPCTANELIATVASARAVAKSADTAGLRRMLGRLSGLPAEPGMYLRLRALIDSDAEIGSIAKELGRDMSITAQLIHVANSAFYGFRTPTRSVAEAVPRLGLNAVTGIVLAADSARSFGLDDASFIHRLNGHASDVAGLLRADRVGDPLEPLAAMVHDIGQIILHIWGRPELDEVDHRCAAEPTARADIEREVLGFDHGSAGGYLLRLWRIDPVVARAVEYHHRPWDLAADDPAHTLAARIAAANVALRHTTEPAERPAWFGDLVHHFRILHLGVSSRG